MNKKIVLYIIITLMVGALVGFLFTKTVTNENNEAFVSKNGNGKMEKSNSQPNRKNCLADDCLAVENLDYPAGDLSKEVQEALKEAINDEYKALSTYEAVIAKFGSVRPFSMIKGAEEQHIASLKAIYDKYGLSVLQNDWTDEVSVPATLQQACQVGVEAEIANANLYQDKLLPIVSDYDDIKAVFTNLMNASREKHLAAFERCN